MECTSLMEGCKPKYFLFILICGFISASWSQDDNRWFGRKHALYVSSGYLNSKRLVSGIDIYPKDSLNQEIHVKLEVLKDWVKVDSAEFDLFLDTTKHVIIAIDNQKYEAIQYRSKDGEIYINFEKPQKLEFRSENGMELISWSCNYATVNYSSSNNRLKKYSSTLMVYYEK